jgi:hypothetical protein
MLSAAAIFLLLAWFPCMTDGAVPAGTTGNRIDFEDIPAGNVVVAIGPDITINAFYEPFDVNPHPLLNSLPVCFDSSKPGLGEKQVALGSPYVLLHYTGLFANLCWSLIKRFRFPNKQRLFYPPTTATYRLAQVVRAWA